MRVPRLIQSPRLVLRPWRAADAAALEPVLAANYAHLAPWIPSRIANPEPAAALEIRLQKFADDFDRDNEWRYAILDQRGTLLGEISLFPRSGVARVPYPEADRIEIGYWVRHDRTARGVATEGVEAILDVVSRDPRFTAVEIRCDKRNEPSNAIPRKLGFSLAEEDLNVWRRPLSPHRT